MLDDAGVFKAVADPTRRQILSDLRGGELSAGEIGAKFPISGPSISRHLSILRAAGLVTERRDANRILYSLVPDRLAICVGSFLTAPRAEQVAPSPASQPRVGPHAEGVPRVITRNIDCIIERRLLVSYRIDPELVDALLPPPFRPQLVNGHAVGGVCFIRMRALRPVPLPRAAGSAQSRTWLTGSPSNGMTSREATAGSTSRAAIQAPGSRRH